MSHENPNTDRSEPGEQSAERTAADEIDPTQDLEDTTFQKKNVLASADHQVEFFGSYTDPGGEDDTARTIEHEFAVYTDPEHRTDAGKPTAVIEEHELMASEHETRRGGDADLTEDQRTELTVDIDPDLEGRQEEAAIEEFCREWHEDHIDRRSRENGDGT